MMHHRFVGIYALVMSVLFADFMIVAAASENPWSTLQEKFLPKAPVIEAAREEEDPWKKLQALPFTEKEEKEALKDSAYSKKVSGKISGKLDGYKEYIKKASRMFNVPEAVISAVIMVESGGDPNAAAKESSAKGLMQLIDATFAYSRSALNNQGIGIGSDPFDPEASVIAGTWYLSRMYTKAAVSDKKITNPDRKNLATWKFPLEYYYAGPGNGVKAANKIIVYSNGEKRVIDKSSYSGKVLIWAEILSS